MQTDPKVVARLAAEREDQNWNFRAFLKGADLTSEEIDAIVHKHYDIIVKLIDCCSCANCCREASPLLRDADIARLAGGLQLSEDEVIGRFLVPGREEGTFTFNKKPCPLRSGNLCSVYDSRPDDCRSYPHLHKDEFVFRLIQAVENCSICPIAFNVFERLKEELWYHSTDPWDDEEY